MYWGPMHLSVSGRLLMWVKSILCLFALMSCLLQINSAWALNKPPIRVTFVNPSTPDAPFWGRLISVMKSAADDLGIELTVVHAHDVRMEYIGALMSEINASNPPDYLVYLYFRQRGVYILEAAEKAGVKSLIINTAIPTLERETVGLPQQKFPHWIGHIYPDDVHAGADLMTTLIQRSIAKGNQTQKIVALSGARSSAPSLERDSGMKSVIESATDASLNQLVHIDWNGEGAEVVVDGLMKRHPDTNVIWAASDSIALKVIDVLEPLPQPQRDKVVVGGMDWSEQGLDAVVRGELDVSLGGHFMEGGWAMVMLHDHFHGAETKVNSPQITTELFSLDQTNVKQLAPMLKANDWQQIDFRDYSIVHHPELTAYPFDWQVILDQMSH